MRVSTSSIASRRTQTSILTSRRGEWLRGLFRRARGGSLHDFCALGRRNCCRYQSSRKLQLAAATGGDRYSPPHRRSPQRGLRRRDGVARSQPAPDGAWPIHGCGHRLCGSPSVQKLAWLLGRFAQAAERPRLTRRRLVWRLWRGECCADLVAVLQSGLPAEFVGMLNGHEVVRSEARTSAGVALVLATALRKPPKGGSNLPEAQTAGHSSRL